MAARFGADAAVGVGPGVTFALFGTQLAREDARVELGVHEIVWGFGLARDNPCSRAADIGAVQVGADAAAQLFEMLRLAQTRVGARGARRGTCLDGFNGFNVIRHMLTVAARVAVEHHFNGFHGSGRCPPA